MYDNPILFDIVYSLLITRMRSIPIQKEKIVSIGRFNRITANLDWETLLPFKAPSFTLNNEETFDRLY